jgi:hypothetical protein
VRGRLRDVHDVEVRAEAERQLRSSAIDRDIEQPVTGPVLEETRPCQVAERRGIGRVAPTVPP